MKAMLKSILTFTLLTSLTQAKVGVCEVLPDAQKEKYLECLVKEAKRTDEVADINMLADRLSSYKKSKEAIIWRKKSIEKGDAEAMYKLATLYSFLQISKKKLNNNEYSASMKKIIQRICDTFPQEFNKPKEAILLYKQAALKEYKDSIAKLSELMETLYGKEGAIKQYKQDIQNGDKNAYRFLANLYVRFENYDAALALYEEALKEDKNNAKTYALIGSLYEAHYKDKTKAKEYYEKAAKLGNATAMYNLGIMAGDAKDYEQAKKWFIASEKAGEKNATGMICYMYQTKLNDDKKAEECNLELANKGNYKDMNELGIFYRHHMRDYKNAIFWYKKAYEAGSSSAAIGLGAHYSSKYEGEYDKEKAIYWYKKAASMGEPGGWSYLYENGAL